MLPSVNTALVRPVLAPGQHVVVPAEGEACDRCGYTFGLIPGERAVWTPPAWPDAASAPTLTCTGHPARLARG